MKTLFPDSPPIPGPRAIHKRAWAVNALPFMFDAVAYMLRLYRNYGEVVTLAEGTDKSIFIFSPEYNRQVLSNSALFYNGDFKSARIYFPENSAAERLMNNGLVVINGDRHVQQRRLMLPAFHKKRVEAYRDAMVELTERRLADWQPGQLHDILSEMRRLTLAVVVKTLFGLDPEREGDPIRRIFEQFEKVNFTPLAVLLQADLPGLPYHTMLRACERVEGEIVKLIAEKRRGGTDGDDVLSMLLTAQDEDGTRLTDAELTAQVLTLFTAGHETTASVLAWTFFLLSQHPPILADLQAELKETLHGDAPRLEQLEQLALLDRVIKESMRLLPPFLWNARTATAPFQLGPYALPEGTTVIYSPAVTHRRPDLYPQPAKFLPERWLNFASTPYNYLPFAAGPRRCLGATFAMQEIKIILALVLQRFSLSLAPYAKINRGARLMLSAPRPGLLMLVNRPNQPLLKADLKGNIRDIIDFGD